MIMTAAVARTVTESTCPLPGDDADELAGGDLLGEEEVDPMEEACE